MHPFHYVLGQRYLRQSETHEKFTCHLANLMVHPRIWPSTHHVFGSISTSQDVSPAWLQPLCYSDQAIPRSVRSVGTPRGNWVSIGTASATTTKPSLKTLRFQPRKGYKTRRPAGSALCPSDCPRQYQSRQRQRECKTDRTAATSLDDRNYKRKQNRPTPKRKQERDRFQRVENLSR
jgi:hypothetical protein